MRIQDWDFSDAYAPDAKADIPHDKELTPVWHMAVIAVPVLLLSCAFAPEAPAEDETASQPPVTYVEVAPE